MYTYMKTKSVRSVATWGGVAVVTLVLSCFGDTEKLFSIVAEQKSVELGGADTTVMLGRGRQRVELFVPANAVPARTQMRVSVVSGTVQRGRSPVTDNAILIEPVGTAFTAPSRMRQLVPSPPAGRTYRVVVVPDNGTSFVVRSRARFTLAASADTDGYEQWEGDATGSGLWGLALELPADSLNETPDAGAADAMAAGTVTGCTPSTAAGCGPNQTCALKCLATGQGESSCVAAGTKQPGEVCSGVGECAPGSQCYDKGCGISICRRYCATNGDCPARTSCSTDVTCPMPLTNVVRLCSQACDPRGMAQTGCAANLRCLVMPGESTECECVLPARVGVDGASCTDSSMCAPGLICVNTGAPVCRPICRLDQPTTCQAGRTCQPLTNPTHVVFGACIP